MTSDMNDRVEHPATEIIDRYVDGELSRDDVQSIALHLLACEPCRSLVADRRALSDRLATLPLEIAPPSDLWSALQQRLTHAVRPEPLAMPATPTSDTASRAWRWRRQHLFLAAAVVLLVLSSAILVTRPPRDRVDVAARAADDWQPTLQPWDVVPASTEPADVERYKRQMETILQEEAHTLSPETMAVLRRNLTVIDRAVEEIQAALDRDPGSPALKQRLLHAYQQQAALVRLVWQAS